MLARRPGADERVAQRALRTLVPKAVFVENADGAIELRRLPKPRPEEIAKLVERIRRGAIPLAPRRAAAALRRAC